MNAPDQSSEPATPAKAALSITWLESASHDEFMTAFGELFEHSPWVAESAWASRPYRSQADLHTAMMSAVRAAPQPQKIAFLRMHPELAGKEAQAGTMTGNSTFEQRGAGLDALSHDEVIELRRLNAAYRRQHGFPFIIAVLGHTRDQIFAALRIRVRNPTTEEIDEALRQIAAITRRRLNALFGASSSDASPVS